MGKEKKRDEQRESERQRVRYGEVTSGPLRELCGVMQVQDGELKSLKMRNIGESICYC